MYKILLADDEGIVIDSLKFIIEKEFKDMCEIETGKTGRAVIELAESFRPDIAIMDIQMPGINGIEAMKEIRRTNSNVIFIVMSAYDKFDYAKEAIKLGVLEYITKPMDRKKMISVLGRAMEMVTEAKEQRANDLLIKEKLEAVVPVLESGLIYNVLFREHFSRDIDNYKAMLEIPEDYSYMMVFVSGEDQEGSYMTNAMGSSVRMVKQYQDIRMQIQENIRCCIGTVMSNKIAVLVPYGSDAMNYNERTALIDSCRELARNLWKKTDIRFRIGIGRVKRIGEMADSYSEALNALMLSTGSVAHADDLLIGCEYSEDYPVDLEKNLFDAIQHGGTDEAVSAAGLYCDWMKGKNLNDVRLKILEFALWAERMAYESGGMTYRFESRQDYLPVVMAMADYSELREWFIDKIAKACHNIRNKRLEKSTSLMETAKEYIDGNFAKNISLEEVSRVINLSPYYFSRVFKEETGVNFVDYITNVRIDKAKELIASGTYSMKEVCAMVGYSDPNYFSRAFKKNVGVSPSEYKDS